VINVKFKGNDLGGSVTATVVYGYNVVTGCIRINEIHEVKVKKDVLQYNYFTIPL